MKATFKLSGPIVAVCLLGLVVSVYAERSDATSQEQEMKQMMDMLKKGGVPPEQMQQMQDMFKGMEGKGRKQSSAKLKKEQQKFEAETAGHGTAQVELEGTRYELTMTECKITDRSTGHFTMSARQTPGKDNVTIGVSSGGGHSGNHIQLLGMGDPYEETGRPTFQLDGKTLKWEGQVAMGSRPKVPLKIRMTCGAEMVDYATPSKPNPKSAENQLTLQLGEETFDFEAGRCSTKEYHTGNLIVEFEVTSTGIFRGRQAIILLSKSHVAKELGGGYFQDMDLFLGELTPEQRLLSPLKVAEQLQDKVNSFTTKEMLAIQKKREKEMAAFQEKYGKDVPKDKDKMAEWSEASNKLLDAQIKDKAIDKVQEQAKAMQYPKGRSFGAITVKGQEIHFGGSKLSTQDASRAPEFKDLPEKTELWVMCGE